MLSKEILSSLPALIGLNSYKKAMYLTTVAFLLLSIVLVGAVSAAPAAPKPKTLATPKLLYPANNAVFVYNENLIIDFSWKPVKNADYYYVSLQNCDASYLNCLENRVSPIPTEQTFAQLKWRNWIGEYGSPNVRWLVYAVTDGQPYSPSAPRYFSVM